MKHYYGIGLYGNYSNWGYIMDDFGNLIAITHFQLDQNIYHRTGVI